HRGEAVGEGVGRLAVLADCGGAVALGDHDLAGGGGGDVQRDPRRRQVVVVPVAGVHVVVDGAGDALQGAADDGQRHGAADVEGVPAGAPDQVHGHAGRRAQDEEVVIALQPVDGDRLDVDVGDVQTGAEDALGGDDEVVVVLGAQHDHPVEAGAAVDVH